MNSIASLADTPVEWLASGDDLLGWLRSAQLLSDETARALRKRALPGEIDAVAVRARALREWFRTFVHAHRGKPLGPKALDELEPLNQLLARSQAFQQIVTRAGEKEAHSSLRLERLRRWPSPDALLLPIAEALAGVVCDEDFTNIKACEGATCSLVYVDRTPTLGRRWCSMAVCGNRSKQAAHRARAIGRRASS